MIDEPKPKRDRDEPVSIPLDPEDALRGLLAAEPPDAPTEKGKTNKRPTEGNPSGPQ